MIGRYRQTIHETPNLSQISCCINLIPGNCAIAELVTTCRHSGFWQNEHVFSCFIVLVTVVRKFLPVLSCCQHFATVRNIKSPNDNARGAGGQ